MTAPTGRRSAFDVAADALEAERLYGRFVCAAGSYCIYESDDGLTVAWPSTVKLYEGVRSEDLR